MNNKYQSTVAHQIAFFAESYCSVLHHTHSHNGWFGYKDTTLTHPFSIHHNPLSIFHCHPVLNIFLFLLCFFTFFHTHNHVFSGPQPNSSFYSCLLHFTQFSCAWSLSFWVLFFILFFLLDMVLCSRCMCWTWWASKLIEILGFSWYFFFYNNY